MIESQSENCLAKNASNISVGVHVGINLMTATDTHLMNNNQPVAEIAPIAPCDWSGIPVHDLDGTGY